jgi:hypothetical protein
MEVPKTLQAAWDKATKNDGRISATEFDKIIATAAPKDTMQELSPDEHDFLAKVHDSMLKSKDCNSEQGVAVTEFSFLNEPELKLAEWPGYTKEILADFTKTFPNAVVEKNNIPCLSEEESQKLARLFGEDKTSGLQKVVGAKEDNKFGPETLFYSREYVIKKMGVVTEPAAMEKLKKIATTLGFEIKE